MFWAQTHAWIFLGLATACLSLLFNPFVRHLVIRLGIMDYPRGRHQHQSAVALWGGLGITLALLLGLWGAYWLFPAVQATFSFAQLLGYSGGLLILLATGLADDRKALGPALLAAGVCTAMIWTVVCGIHISRVTHPFGGVWELSLGLSWLSSFLWLLFVTGATKFADGIDGLVTGQTIIGAILIALLTTLPAFSQPGMTIVAACVAGAFLGFLPYNLPPARHFLGEAGSTIAGFSLGVLAILSGAKLAIALMALAIPLMDGFLVMARRVWLRRAPWQGDRSHLHFRLQAAGLTPLQITLTIWTLSAAFGLAALRFQTQGKLILVILLAIITLVLSEGASWIAQRRISSL